MSNKTKKILKSVGLWFVTLGVAGLFLMSGAGKLMASDPYPASFAKWGYDVWFMYVTGALEVAAAVALLVPRVASLGALALGGVMAGAAVIHLTHGEYAFIGVNAVLFGALVLIGYARRDWVIERFGLLAEAVTVRNG